MPEQGSTTFEQGWQRRFRNFAELRDDDAGIAGWSVTGLECRFRNFSRLWRRGEGAAVWLDAGCGAGTYSRFLAANGVRVLGLDYSMPTLQKAERRAAGGVSWVLGDVTHLPVRRANFDGVLCFGVLQALGDSERAVAELAQSVKPGGEVWIDALNAWCIPNLIERLSRKLRGAPAHLRYESRAGLQWIMRRQGLTDVRLEWMPILPGRWQRFQPMLEGGKVRWMLRRIPLIGAMFSHAFIIRSRRA
jgi:SAM-dependent methyltransferase